MLRVGRQLLRYERHSRRDVERTQDLDRDLQRASQYVLSLLPAPLETGPVHATWRFLPSAQYPCVKLTVSQPPHVATPGPL